MLLRGAVSEIYLNDLDPRIAAFWWAVLNETERFATLIMNIPLTMDEWERQKQICTEADTADQFELGFSAFFMNRCNRSGVIFGAGPIGGSSQKGRWKMAARFYRATLASRVRRIAGWRAQIHVTNFDALEFIRLVVDPANQSKNTLMYLDPPYHRDGNRLYLNIYDDDDHATLAKQLQNETVSPWIASYNNATFIRDLYSNCLTCTLPIRYKLQNKHMAEELIIAGPGVTLPASTQSFR